MISFVGCNWSSSQMPNSTFRPFKTLNLNYSLTEFNMIFLFKFDAQRTPEEAMLGLKYPLFNPNWLYFGLKISLKYRLSVVRFI